MLRLPGVQQGRSYGYPAFLVAGRFFARFRDDETVLAIRLSSIADRDVLMRLDPNAFFFTDHYRDYPAVLVRLAEVKPALLATVLKDARLHIDSPAAEERGRARPRRRRPPSK
jgi:hypothetical protein